MLIDAHLDLAFIGVVQGADLRLPLPELRQTPYGASATERQCTPTVSLPAIREADIRLVFGSVFAQPPTDDAWCGPVYHTPEEARQQGWDQVHYYQKLADSAEITLVQDRAQLDGVLQSSSPLPGIVLSMEGADPLVDIGELEQWCAAGLRIIGPAWRATRFCGGTQAPGPLTAMGRKLVDAMGEYALALDTSHMSDESFWEALDRFDGPVIASHSNCRAIVPTDRHLSDAMIREIAARDGVIGIVPYNPFLTPDGRQSIGKEKVTLEAVVRHIEHICELTGSIRHVGLGSDFDGGFGVEGIPAELESITDLPQIGDALRETGWPSTDVDAFLFGNWMRWLRSALPT